MNALPHNASLPCTGRAAPALAQYRQLRDRLVDELSTEPGVALQALHRRILDADPALVPADSKPSASVPQQLPAPPRWFTGRDAELIRLDEALTTGPAATVLISAIGGTGGIGKTWLALHRQFGTAMASASSKILVRVPSTSVNNCWVKESSAGRTRTARKPGATWRT
jgi:hypothetical protein